MRTGLSATLLISLLAVSSHAYAFLDVDKDTRYQEAIQQLFEDGILQGYEDRTFKPTAVINRAEFTKIVVEAFYPHYVIASCVDDLQKIHSYFASIAFPDVNYLSWYGNYVCVGQLTGLIGGYPDGTFRPGDTISFVEVAKILAVAFKLTTVNLPNLGELTDLWYRPYVDAIDDLKAIPPTIATFEQPLRRGEMAELLYRLSKNSGTAIQVNEPYNTYEDIATNAETSVYMDKRNGFTLKYPSQWPEPHMLGRGVYDQTAPYSTSLFRLYLGPDKEKQRGYGSSVQRDYYIDKYDHADFEDALGLLVVDPYIHILADTDDGKTLLILYEEKGANCTSQKAMIVTDTDFYRFTGMCGADIPSVARELDRLMDYFKIIPIDI